MEKWNATFDRWRGLSLVLLPVGTVVLSIVGALLALRTDLGYASVSPTARIAKVEEAVLELRAEVSEIRTQSRPLLINLCFEASDTVLALIEEQVKCSVLTPRRGQQR